MVVLLLSRHDIFIQCHFSTSVFMFNIEKKSLEDTVRHSTLQEGINFLVGFSADAIPVATASMNSNYFINIKHIKQRRLHNLKK